MGLIYFKNSSIKSLILTGALVLFFVAPLFSNNIAETASVNKTSIELNTEVAQLSIKMTKEEWLTFTNEQGWDSVALIGQNGDIMIFEAFKCGVKVADVYLTLIVTPEIPEVDAEEGVVTPDIEDKVEIEDSIIVPMEPSIDSSSISVVINYMPTITMSLSTNNISFNNISGAEDNEIKNGLMISINSNLPYSINATLLKNIESLNKDILDNNILNIKESTSQNYLSFNEVNSSVEILSNLNPSGINKHYFDFKINAAENLNDLSYETKIKFEAVNK